MAEVNIEIGRHSVYLNIPAVRLIHCYVCKELEATDSITVASVRHLARAISRILVGVATLRIGSKGVYSWSRVPPAR